MTEENAKRFGIFYKKRSKLMCLPYELRHEVLSYLCEIETMPVFLRGRNGMPPTAIPLPPIARAGDSALRAEAILVNIKQTTLEIHSGPGNAELRKWLSSIDFSVSGETSLESGFDAVHSLSFPYFSRYPHASLPVKAPNNDIQLMAKCHNLRKVTLTFVLPELVNYNNVSAVPKPVDQLRREYRLDSMLSMFQLGELRTIALRGPLQGTRGYTSLQALATWLRSEYAIRANLQTHLANSKKSTKALEVSIN